MAAEENGVVRKIYFFKIEHFFEIKESLPGAIERIDCLPFDDTGRYRFDTQSHMRFCAFPDTLTYPLRIRFGKIRRDALPQTEHEGSLKTIELQENAGLIDISHVVIFSDGFVAAEWNHEGPKLAQLSPYIFDKGKLNNPPKFFVLMERDIFEVVNSLISVKVLEIELPPDAAELARQADESFYTAIRAAEALGATKKVALKLTSDDGAGKLRTLARRFAEIIRDYPHERERFSELSINGYDGKSRLRRFVDILESKLVSSVLFQRTSPRSRSISSDDAYRVIERAYLENLEKLRTAATSVDWR